MAEPVLDGHQLNTLHNGLDECDLALSHWLTGHRSYDDVVETFVQLVEIWSHHAERVLTEERDGEIELNAPQTATEQFHISWCHLLDIGGYCVERSNQVDTIATQTIIDSLRNLTDAAATHQKMTSGIAVVHEGWAADLKMELAEEPLETARIEYRSLPDRLTPIYSHVVGSILRCMIDTGGDNISRHSVQTDIETTASKSSFEP